MISAQFRESFSNLSTPLICDACLRLEIPYQVRVGASDFVVGDDDGLVFASIDQAGKIFEVADGILSKERDQAKAIRSGTTLRVQLRFAEYLEARNRDPSYTLRKHLRRVGGAIEE